MKTEAPPVPAPPESDGGITIHNRLHPGHRYRAAMDEVFRVALRGLPGPWDVSVTPSAGPGSASTSSRQTERAGPCRSPFTRARCRGPRGNGPGRLRPPLPPPTGEAEVGGQAGSGSAGDRDGGPKALAKGRGRERALSGRPGRNAQMKIEATVKQIRALLQLAELDQSADPPTVGGLAAEAGRRVQRRRAAAAPRPLPVAASRSAAPRSSSPSSVGAARVATCASRPWSRARPAARPPSTRVRIASACCTSRSSSLRTPTPTTRSRRRDPPASAGRRP